MTDTAVSAPPLAPFPSPTTDIATPPDTRRRDWVRVLGACILLLLVYGALSLTTDPRGALGADSGGKLATLHVMDQRGTLVPDVGYWAARYDPSGLLHPLVYTRHVGDRYVQVTTLPMIELAAPLYDLGGTRAALLLPMLGAVLTALAARALARRFGGGEGWTAFWAVGLLTPVAIYAIDFWEHSMGLGLMVWGVVFLADVVERRAGWRGGVVAGLLFGAAATLRTEALVYLVVATGVACLLLVARERRLGRAIRTGLLVLVGALVPLVMNSVLERVVLGNDLRAGRAAGTAAASGSGASGRLQEGLTSAVGVGFADLKPSADWLLGAIVVVLVGAGALALRSADRRVRTIGLAADVLAALLLVMRFGTGLGFVPGVLVASPLAAAGLFVCWRDRRTSALGVVALIALPLCWAAQYTGSMWPQWGGRYVLVSGVLLAIGACIVLRHAPRALLATCILAGMVTAGGVVWLSERTHTNAEGMEQILARHDEVLIARHAQLFREVGAFYTPSSRWLTAPSVDDLHRAVGITRESGADEFATIGPEGQSTPRELGDYVRGRTELVPFTRSDVRVQVTTYRLRS